MVDEFELKRLVEVYKYLQLCKNLRQPTWQKQIHEYHKKIGRYKFQIVTPAVNSVQLNLGDFSYAA